MNARETRENIERISRESLREESIKGNDSDIAVCRLYRLMENFVDTFHPFMAERCYL